MNKFAVILPTISRETLIEAVASVLAQSYKEYRLIISCNTTDIFNKVIELLPSKRDQELTIISHGCDGLPNDSGASARNYAIKFVPSDCNWITYIDDDDRWHPNRLSSFNNFIEKHSDDTDFKLFYSYGDLYKMKHKSPRSSKKELRQVGVINNITAGGMCHTLDVFNKTNGWNPDNTQDHDMELYKAMRFYCNDDVLESSTFDFIWRD